MSLEPNDQLFTAPITDKLVAVLVSQALRQEHAATDAVVKRIARATQASPTTVRKWYEGLNAPSSANLLTLMGTYGVVLQTMLHIAGRGDVLDVEIKGGDAPLNVLRQTVYGDRFVTLNVIVNAKIASNLNQRQLWFVGELQQDRGVRVGDLVRVWSICLRTARRDVRVLVETRIIYFSGGKRNGRYRLM